MLKILLIEDEPLAMDQLVYLVNKWKPAHEIIGQIESLEEGQRWLKKNDWPDVIISDVQLGDGLSIHLFKDGVPESCKIIFATAFDQYAIDAFRLQAQDYLLKPIEENQLHTVLDKIKDQSNPSDKIDYNELANVVVNKIRSQNKVYLIRFNNQLVELNSNQIAYIYIEDRSVLAMTFDSRKLPMDKSLDQLEEELDENQFFRANRGCILNHKAIDKIKSYSSSKLLIETQPSFIESEIIISKEKSPVFKNWLSQRKDFRL